MSDDDKRPRANGQDSFAARITRVYRHGLNHVASHWRSSFALLRFALLHYVRSRRKLDVKGFVLVALLQNGTRLVLERMTSAEQHKIIALLLFLLLGCRSR